MALIDELIAAILGHLDRPFAVFGHSLGGLAGFALVRELERRGLPTPVLLVVSGSEPGGRRRRRQLHELADAGLYEAKKRGRNCLGVA